MDAACPLNITQREFDDIKQCEAVVIREYEGADGVRFGKAVAYGDEADMMVAADTPDMFVVPVGFSIVAQSMVLVSDLLSQQENTPDAGN